MGVVYKAEDQRLGRPVALKFLPEDIIPDQATLERFRREARTASALNHPHICTIYDIDEHEGQPFIAMEFLDGETLKHRLGGKPVPVRDILDLGMQIADALDVAHSQPHHSPRHQARQHLRDPRAARSRCSISDSRSSWPNGARPTRRASPICHQTAGQEFKTSPGTTIGTVAYMSPEQARGEELDVRTDLFSLGVVLYEMATGTLPFTGPTSAVIFEAILNRAPESVVQRNSRLPEEFERIVHNALEKDRETRYQNAGDVRADLLRLKRQLESGRAPASAPSPAGTRQGPRRRSQLAALAGLAVVAAVAAGFYMTRESGRIPSTSSRRSKQAASAENSDDVFRFVQQEEPRSWRRRLADVGGSHRRVPAARD